MSKKLENFDKTGGIGNNGVVGITAAVERDIEEKRAAVQRWSKHKLPSGKMLSDASTAELEEAARHFEKELKKIRTVLSVRQFDNR